MRNLKIRQFRHDVERVALRAVLLEFHALIKGSARLWHMTVSAVQRAAIELWNIRLFVALVIVSHYGRVAGSCALVTKRRMSFVIRADHRGRGLPVLWAGEGGPG